jgi:hypothetical protein
MYAPPANKASRADPRPARSEPAQLPVQSAKTRDPPQRDEERRLAHTELLDRRPLARQLKSRSESLSQARSRKPIQLKQHGGGPIQRMNNGGVAPAAAPLNAAPLQQPPAQQPAAAQNVIVQNPPAAANAAPAVAVPAAAAPIAAPVAAAAAPAALGVQLAVGTLAANNVATAQNTVHNVQNEPHTIGLHNYSVHFHANNYQVNAGGGRVARDLTSITATFVRNAGLANQVSYHVTYSLTGGQRTLTFEDGPPLGRAAMRQLLLNRIGQLRDVNGAAF